ncbi:hypothetical protein [Colwellia sp. Bg11-28]|uniref:hypothetical protein n=1 Tax=Colwellia sp. Bg11-28 TaxID=2058305 RepID=UPI000C33B2AC|nr:hypothetical protein [Colwellia sp. Bg11-28]PKH88645.1 hypothetical protein CXF79_04525 [Colwellia sp. Bg11-28]
MPKLTKEQMRLLIWLSYSATYFEICRQVGYSYRQVNGLKSYVNKDGVPYKFDMRTLNKLVNENLVQSEIIYPYGVKHEHYFLTQAGQVYVSMLAISK